MARRTAQRKGEKSLEKRRGPEPELPDCVRFLVPERELEENQSYTGKKSQQRRLEQFSEILS